MPDPLVSIIIPVYNSEKYLAETISSALAQTWINKELIIIDDGSTDTSLIIAQTFASEAVKVIHQNNKGASSARNKGLEEAKGDYIQFLDADDLLMPNKIASQLKQLSGKKDMLSVCPVVHFNEFDIDITGLVPTESELSLYKDSNDPFEFLLRVYDLDNKQGTLVPIHSWLTPATLTKKIKWDESLTVNDDGEYFCRVVLASAGILAKIDTLCYYRKYVSKNTTSLSGRPDENSLESQFRSLLLIRGHLSGIRQDERINGVIASNLMMLLMKVYPRYKILTKTILQTIREMGGTTYSPILGGKVIESLKHTFGWKTARILQFYLHYIIY